MKNKAFFIERPQSLNFNQFRIFILFLFGFASTLMGQIIAVNTSYVMNLSENQTVKMIGIENITPIGSFSVHKGLASGAPTILKIDITPTGFHHAYLANQLHDSIYGILVIRNLLNSSNQTRRIHLFNFTLINKNKL